MLKIGLTGGIGSGKSTVAEIFAILGIPVYDADRETKLLMERDPHLAEGIVKLFGGESYIDGVLNRKYISGIVFNNPFRLEQLNALVHPVTIAAANRWMGQQHAPYVVKEAALMFEAGSASHLNYVIGVYAPQHLRIARVMERDKSERDQVLARMNRQIDETIKMKLCDYVVVNNEQQLLIPQVLQLHQKFLAIAKNGSYT